MNEIERRVQALSRKQREELELRLGTRPAPQPQDQRLRLIAYYQTRPSAQPDANLTAQIKDYLQAGLPEYMRPHELIGLAEIPRLPNGKVDLTALPEPTNQRSQTARKPDLPSPTSLGETSAAEQLAAILGNILGMDEVLVEDNFFELGGDSITAIQFVSMAREAGIHIAIADLNNSNNLLDIANAQTSPVLVSTEISPTGPTPLTPIQAWFFDQQHPRPNHWNQAGCFELTRAISADTLRQAVSAVIARHPALGQSFQQHDGQWTSDIPEGLAPDRVLAELPDSSSAEAINDHLNQTQKSWTLEAGWMIHVLITVSSQGYATKLHWVAHHLIVDNLTVQILLREIERACEARAESDLASQNPSVSLREWAQHMNETARQAGVTHQSSRPAAGKRPDNRALPAPSTEADCLTVTSVLPNQAWQQLTLANAAYSTQTFELLMAAISRAWLELLNVDSTSIDIEGHGRDALGPSYDTSASVGWFTSFFPLTVRVQSDLDALIKSTKESLRQTREDSRHYLLETYLAPPDSLAHDNARQQSTPTLLINFAGATATAELNESLWRPGQPPAIALRAGENLRAHDLELNAILGPEGLSFIWRFAERSLTKASVESLDKHLRELLGEISTHCTGRGEKSYTPSDFPDVDLDQDDLDNLLSGLD